jgi:hypothetical protein
MIQELDKLQNMGFYVPFSINKDNISDLGEVLSNSKEVLNAVFNETYILKDHNKQKQVKVLDENDDIQFVIYSLAVSSNVTIKEEFDGSIIKIYTKDMNIDSQIKYYFRFRITSNNLESFIKKRQSSNWLLQSATSSNYFIDFRFNDRRSLDSSLLEYMDNIEKLGTVVGINKIHFLLLTRADVDLFTNTFIKTFTGERQLEKHIWKKYLEYEPNNIIVANHWKFAENNCIIYIKFKVNKCNIKTILTYIFILFMLTVAFNTISSILFEWIKIWFPKLVPVTEILKATL